MLVCLYGRFVGYSSLANVSWGWFHSLKNDDLLGCVPLLDPLGGPDWNKRHPSSCPIAVVCDPALLVNALAGGHERIYALVSLHTSWVPNDWMCMFEHPRVRLVCPGESSRSLLVAGPVKDRAEVVAHGISDAFVSKGRDIHLKALHETPGFRFRLVHLVESEADRKGTVPLLDALEQVGRSDVLLIIISASMQYLQLKMYVSQHEFLKSKVVVLPRVNGSPEKMWQMYQSMDAVVQPSRTEAFGLVPVEAICSGVPAIVTTCNGHVDWLDHVCGTVQIPVGKSAPLSADAGECPVVHSQDIAEGLERFIHSAHEIQGHVGPTDRARFTWDSATQAWRERIKEEFGD